MNKTEQIKYKKEFRIILYFCKNERVLIKPKHTSASSADVYHGEGFSITFVALKNFSLKGSCYF